MSRKLIIEAILSLEELEQRVAPRLWQQAQRFVSERRRREWLSWRYYLACEIGVEHEVAYSDQGAPYIIGSDLFISVSHTRTHIAILLSDRPCAIDMELVGRNFQSVLSRYLSSAEREVMGGEPSALAIAWCAKEAAYKYSSRSLDFIKDIIIQSVDYEQQRLELLVDGGVVSAQFEVGEEWVVVFLG